MADYTAIIHSAVVQGASGVNDTIYLTGSVNGRVLEVLNVDGGGRIAFRADGTAAVQDAAENKCIAAVAGNWLRLPVLQLAGAGGQVKVSIVASANCKYQASLVQEELGGR